MARQEIVVISDNEATEYIEAKLFGNALEGIGDEIHKLNQKGRDKLIGVAIKKIENLDDEKMVNLRATREIIWNGSFPENEVCAEYFGGILAAARSEDGKDDTAVNYLDTIKAMSTTQLEFHYLIYKAWHLLLKKSDKAINVGASKDVHAWHIFLNSLELKQRKLPFDRDLPVLSRLGLIQQYQNDEHVVGNKSLAFTKVIPTTYGLLLFVIAHNKINTWRNFKDESYESVIGIKQLLFFAENLEQLSVVSCLV